VIDAITDFAYPHGTKEVAWYESDNCFGCVVYSEPQTRHFPKSPDYFCMVFPKGEHFDIGYMEPLDKEGGFEDITLAEAFLRKRLAALE
jgi:hypothetical protein